MKILVLDSQQIRELLPMRDCIELMADALSALARDEVFQPLRTIIRPPDARGLLGLMPAYRSWRAGRVWAESDLRFSRESFARQRCTPGRSDVVQPRDRRIARVDECFGDHGDSHCGCVSSGDSLTCA